MRARRAAALAAPEGLLRALASLAALALVLAWSSPARAEHLRDLADVAGARDNQLVGFGLVTGLNGTGDDVTVPFAQQAVLSMLRRLGVQIDSQQIRLRNVAAVTVTATLPPFAKQGTKIDVTVASLGNAHSLSGGVLVQTVLKGADQRAYAVAQGSILLGGFSAHGASGSSTSSGTTTTGRVPEGALVEREVQTSLVEGGALRLELRNPGFTVAARVVEAVNKKFASSAAALDGGAVTIKVPTEYAARIVEFVAALEEIEITPLRRARVVINERTGTIVAGGDVRLAPVAVVHGSLTIVVKETPEASQPTAAFGQGSTVVTPRSEIQTSEGNRSMVYVPAAPTLADVATALGTLGLSPREMASVLQALRGAGALEAEVVVE
ncbi:MAG: flagellar basal body P-ring protein FlgI [Myxococcales bacterium]|nr:flagellar basal body P-ring protein FlgI [Myxococcales bacterium]